MKARDREDLLFLYAADALEPDERDEVEAWIAGGGAGAAAEVARAELEVARLAASRGPVAAPEAVRRRLRVRAEAAAAPRPRDAAPRRRGLGVLTQAAIAAGFAALAAGAAVGAWVERVDAGRASALESRITTLATDLDRTRAELETERAAAAAAQDEIAELEARHRALESDLVIANKAIMVLRSEEMQSLFLAGTKALPSAHGRVFWDWKNWYCYMHAEGVTPDPKKTYAIWLFTEDGDVIGVGTFHPDAHGEAIFLAPVPHDVGHVVRAGVSVEPDEDIGTRPRGEVVMTGTT